jgi:hypothetical protein
MGRAKGLLFSAVVALVVASGGLPGCGGAGCSCVAPYPAGVTMPEPLIVENGIQVRLTDQGFAFLEQNLGSILAGTLGGGLCLPGSSLGLLVADVDYCNDDPGRYLTGDVPMPASSYYCSDGSVGCPIELTLNQVDFTLQAPNQILVFIDLTLGINFRFTVSEFTGADFSCASDCDLGGSSPGCATPGGHGNMVHADNLQMTATIEVNNDPTTRHLSIALVDVTDLSLPLDIGTFSQVDENCASTWLGDICPALSCGAVEVVGDLLTGLVGFLAPLLEGFLAGFLDPLVQGFVPNPPGAEGVLDLGALLGSLAPPAGASMEISDIAGGDPAMGTGGYVPSFVTADPSTGLNGLEIGVRSAANSDITIMDSMDGRSTPNPCVPARTFNFPPEIGAAAGSPARTLPFAAEFMADSVPALPGMSYDVGIGVAEAVLDAGAFNLFNSGGMCLAFGSNLSAMLNTGLFSLLVPSLTNLTHGESAPMVMALRPLDPPDVTVGAGSDNDPTSPLITIDIPNLNIDVYAFVEERYVRVFTMTPDLTVQFDLDVQMTTDPVTGDVTTELVPVFDPSSGIQFNNVRVTNNEMIAEDAASLEAILPTLITLAAPFISGAIQPIALPAFNGFVLNIQEITRVLGNLPGGATHPFLSIFATLAYMPPGALIIDVDTVASLRNVFVPPLDAWRATGLPPGTLGGTAAAALDAPEVTFDVDGASAVPGAEYEWQWRVDGGLWSHWYPVDEARPVRDPLLWLQGWHDVEVRSRIAGNPWATDMTPEAFRVLIDNVPPRVDVRSDEDAGVLEVSASDAVTPAAKLVYTVRWSDGATSTLDPAAPVLSFAETVTGGASRTPVALEVRDEAGNTTTRHVDSDTMGFHQNTPTTGAGGGGCGCVVAGGRGSGSGSRSGAPHAVAAVLLLGLFLVLRRRRSGGAADVATTTVPAGGGASAAACASRASGRALPPGFLTLVVAVALGVVFSGLQGCVGCCRRNPGVDCLQECGPMGGTPNDDGMTCTCNNPSCMSDQDCAEFPCIGGGYPYCDLMTMMCACYPTIPAAEPGRYSEVGVANGTAYISAYSDVLGDLMLGRVSATGGGTDRPIACAVDTECPATRPCNQDRDHDGTFDACAPAIVWEYVDGVPDEPPTSDPTGERGGISAAGEDVGLYTSIAMLPDGNPAISYYDKTNGDLKYAWYDGASWNLTVVDAGVGFDADVGRYTSVTLDATGAPGIAYFAASVDDGAGGEVTQARFAQATTTTPVGPQSWVVYVIAEAPVVPPDPTATPLAALPMGVGLFNSATRMSDGRPAVAFYDRLTTSPMLSTFDSAAGAFIIPAQLDGGIDPASGLDTGDDGQWVSLAVDATDSFHLSYVDASRDDLVYLYIDAASGAATREVVDPGLRSELAVTGEMVNVFALVGEDSSLVLDASVPFIVYQDATYVDLTYASRDAAVVTDPAAGWAVTVLAGNSVKAYEGGLGFYADQVIDLATGNAVITSWTIDQQVDPLYRGMLVIPASLSGL